MVSHGVEEKGRHVLPVGTMVADGQALRERLHEAPKHWTGNEQTKGSINALSKFLKVTNSYLSRSIKLWSEPQHGRKLLT